MAEFARYLELEIEENKFIGLSSLTPWYSEKVFGNYSGGFVYEPDGFTVDGWTPDFLTWTTFVRNPHPVFNGMKAPMTDWQLYEYKPSKPTDTYIATFKKRASLLRELIESVFGCDVARCCSIQLYYGSIYTNCRGTVCYLEGANDDYDWLSEHEESIRETRFDLKAS